MALLRGDLVDKDILKGLSGVLQPARFTAVMGASGAGKTTFLNILVCARATTGSSSTPPRRVGRGAGWVQHPQNHKHTPPPARPASRAQAGQGTGRGVATGNILINSEPVSVDKMREISGYVVSGPCPAQRSKASPRSRRFSLPHAAARPTMPVRIVSAAQSARRDASWLVLLVQQCSGCAHPAAPYTVLV